MQNHDQAAKVELLQVESVKPLRPYKRPATARQFKPGDPKVLRFFGKWVDTKASKEGSKNMLYRAKVLQVILITYL